MHKKSLTDRQMFSDAACVEYAATWSSVIVKDHYRGPGDMENALRAAATEAKVPYGFLWRLKYRRATVKVVSPASLFRLAKAYGAKPCRREMARDPLADAVAVELMKLAETFREVDTRASRKAASELLDTACEMGCETCPVGEACRAVADGRRA